jgi:hypothetical protein
VDTGGDREGTGGDREGSGPGYGERDEAEDLARCDNIWERWVRVAGRFGRLPEAVATAALTSMIRGEAELSRDDLAAGLAVFAVRSQRSYRPLAGHPAAEAAEAALQAEIGGDRVAANRLVAEALRAGPGSLDVVVMTWAAAYEHHATGGREPVTMTGSMMVLDYSTGREVAGDRVRPEMRWAADLLRSYVNDEPDRFGELMAQVTPQNAGAWLAALAGGIAGTVSALPQGWALMGDGAEATGGGV